MYYSHKYENAVRNKERLAAKYPGRELILMINAEEINREDAKREVDQWMKTLIQG